MNRHTVKTTGRSHMGKRRGEEANCFVKVESSDLTTHRTLRPQWRFASLATLVEAEDAEDAEEAEDAEVGHEEAPPPRDLRERHAEEEERGILLVCLIEKLTEGRRSDRAGTQLAHRPACQSLARPACQPTSADLLLGLPADLGTCQPRRPLPCLPTSPVASAAAVAAPTCCPTWTSLASPTRLSCSYR